MRGDELLANRYRNKGTAFTMVERERLGLTGLLPPVVESLDTQLQRVRAAYDLKTVDLERHVFLRALQERNSVLFYRFLLDNLEEVLPIVYTPTVGLACEDWSRAYRKEHGLYVSGADVGQIRWLVANAIKGGRIDVAVVTDGERVLGLGDLGGGGMGISIGKLALYTAVGGVDPSRTLPIMLDVGSNNEALLSDPLYLGWRRQRLIGRDYDAVVDELVDALTALCPGLLLQWEDFANHNAARLLERHRHRICSFNDDIQGTAAVAAASVVSGLGRTGVAIKDLRVVVLGAGSAGTGIANQLVSLLIDAGVSVDEARRRVWLVDRDGLVHQDMDGLDERQRHFARPVAELARFERDRRGRVDLAATVAEVGPHALIGVTGQPGLFTESVIRKQAAKVERPIVLPLSNPTPRAEAIPADVLNWTGGRALVGTGSPFPPVTRGSVTHRIAQVNNVYVFPGIGLGTVVSKASQVTDGMITAATLAVADAAAATDEVALLPPVGESPEVSRSVAVAVARRAIADGVSTLNEDQVEAAIDAAFWAPEYRPT